VDLYNPNLEMNEGDNAPWPLVMLFGSFRPRGLRYLTALRNRLREKNIKAFIVDDELYHEAELRGKGIAPNELDTSLSIAGDCDIGCFFFFSGRTLGTPTNLEAMDQAVAMELTAYYLAAMEDRREGRLARPRAKMFFDSKERKSGCSHLLLRLMGAITEGYPPEIQIPVYPPANHCEWKIVRSNATRKRELVRQVGFDVFNFCVQSYMEFLDERFPGDAAKAKRNRLKAQLAMMEWKT